MAQTESSLRIGKFSSRPAFETILKAASVIALVYLFILSITLLGDAFKLFGKEFAEGIFTATRNPVVGLAIGVLATAIVQSSSTTTSIIVGMVGSGTLPFEAAVPMIMGANIGTSITNLLVSLAHLTRSDEFKRAFAGSVVHDFFNICTVVVLLPLQVMFNVVGVSAHIVEAVFAGSGGLEFTSPIKLITNPVANFIIHATGGIAWVSVIISLFMLFIALRYLVKIMKSLVLAKVEKFFQRYIFRTPLLGLVLGLVLTTIVQSSSITTSMVVPLLGAGVLTITQVFPYMLGANVGTTVTAFLASLAIGSNEAIAIAFSHFLFNVYGIAIFWPLQRIPITMAKSLAELTTRSKLYPLAYIVITFVIIPGGIIFLGR